MIKTANATAQADRLPFATKLVYGMGDWGNTTTSTIFAFFFAFFLNDVAGLQPLYAAPVLLIGGIWDAINDPMIGVLADRVRTRWGRRRPFFIIGALPLAISFTLLWWTPALSDQISKAIYYTICYLFFDTAFTFLMVPYAALTPELTEDYDERTRLNGYRMTVSMAGGLIAAVSVPLFIEIIPDRKLAYLAMAAVFGVLAGIPYIVLFFKIRERFQDAPCSQLNLFSGFAYTWRNHAFRYAAGIYLTAWVTVSLVASLFQYYVTYWLRRPDQLDILLGLVQGAALLCIPIMVWMASRMGKQKAYLIGVAWWVLVMIALAILPSNGLNIAYFLAVSTGLGIAGAHVVPWSIIPDVIEADELETGQRQEATYYGFLVFLQKTGAALTLAFVQLVFANTGYVSDAPQNEATLSAIRLLIGAMPAVLLAVSMYLTWRYPINRARHSELRAALAEKRIQVES